MSDNNEKLDVFINGNTIDLCIPTGNFARNSNWYSWFNDPKITRYLEQGLYPNTSNLQEEFFQSQQDQRLLLVVSTKDQKYKGVVSLSKIDLNRRRAEIAVVTDNKIEPRKSPYAALEAIALVTQHGFDVIGLNRIQAGQHINLMGMQQRMELFGYRIEGIHKQSFVKGHRVEATMSHACVYDDYKRIVQRRGKLWDSLDLMAERIRLLPKKPFAASLSEYLHTGEEEYYKKIWDI